MPKAEDWLAGGLYLGSAIFMMVSYSFWCDANKAQKQREDLQKQDSVYDLDRLKALKYSLAG